MLRVQGSDPFAFLLSKQAKLTPEAEAVYQARIDQVNTELNQTLVKPPKVNSANSTKTIKESSKLGHKRVSEVTDVEETVPRTKTAGFGTPKKSQVTPTKAPGKDRGEGEGEPKDVSSPKPKASPTPKSYLRRSEAELREIEENIREEERLLRGLAKAQKLVLMPTQLEAQVRQDKILDEYKLVVNTTEPSGGKTTQTLDYALRNGLDLMVFCTLSGKVPWIFETDRYDGKILSINTYGESRGNKKNDESAGGYLNRFEDDDGISYQPTDKFFEDLSKGVVMVVDEVHHIFNEKAQQAQAIGELINAANNYLVKHPDCPSRIALLSGTAALNVNHIVWYLHIMGFFTEGQITSDGIEEILGKVGKVKSSLAKRLRKSWDKSPQDKAAMKKICKEVWKEFVKKEQMIQAPRPNIIPPHICNKIYDVAAGFAAKGKTREARILRQKYRKELERIVAELEDKTSKLSPFDSTMTKVCKLLFPLFSKIVTDKLRENINAKCIVVLPSVKALERVNADINAAGYHSEIFYGKSSLKQRMEIIKKFNEPSSELNCICLQIRTGSEAISLQDLDGNFPRFMYIFPTYSFIDEYQVIFRIYRPGAKSSATIEFVYGEGALEFINLRANRNEKNEGLRDFSRVGESFDTSSIPLEYAPGVNPRTA